VDAGELATAIAKGENSTEYRAIADQLKAIMARDSRIEYINIFEQANGTARFVADSEYGTPDASHLGETGAGSSTSTSSSRRTARHASWPTPNTAPPMPRTWARPGSSCRRRCPPSSPEPERRTSTRIGGARTSRGTLLSGMRRVRSLRSSASTWVCRPLPDEGGHPPLPPFSGARSLASYAQRPHPGAPTPGGQVDCRTGRPYSTETCR